MIIDIQGTQTKAYVVGGLQPATEYAFSVLAYTVADGPRTTPLTATTFSKEKFMTVYTMHSQSLAGLRGKC